MPKYFFRETATGREFSEVMKISEQETFLKNNPQYKSFPGNAGDSLHPGSASLLHSGRGLGGGLRIDSGFNDVLNKIKKGSGRQNSINTK
jgi:hypothetical protein